MHSAKQVLHSSPKVCDNKQLLMQISYLSTQVLDSALQSLTKSVYPADVSLYHVTEALNLVH